MGNVAPEFSTLDAPSSPGSDKKNEEYAARQLATDKTRPTTKIQVRLADGTKWVFGLIDFGTAAHRATTINRNNAFFPHTG